MKSEYDLLSVLIVDDEEGMCLGAMKALSSTRVYIDDLDISVGFSTRAVHTFKDYKNTTETNRFDLVLLDYKLPDGNGLDILQEITEQEKGSLVIMMTAYATFETAVQATKLGAYDFLAKPFTPEELRNSVRKAATRFVLSQKAKQFEEEKKRIRFEFISVLSHELKSPLNAIDGYLKLLKEGSIEPGSENYHMAIDRSLVRLDGMRKLIFDLLDLTRIESGQKKRNIEEVNLDKIINQSIDQNRYLAEQNHITLYYNPMPSVTMMADPTEIEIIFNNLISNAIKYNRPKGLVEISLSTQKENIKIMIKDSGIGLTEEESKKLFNDFVRIKNNETQNIQGSGLGLSTVKKIAALYDGTVCVESQKSVGSTFIITLKNIINNQVIHPEMTI